MNPNVRLFLVLVGLSALWAPVNLCVKTASRDLSEGAILLLRWSAFAGSLWVLSLAAPFRKSVRWVTPKPMDALRALAIGVLLVAPAHAMYYVGVRGTSTIESTVLGVSSPLWTALFALKVLDEKVTGHRWSAIMLGVVGAYVVSIGFGLPQMQGTHAPSNLLYLGGVVSESLAMVLAVRIILRSSGIGALAFEVLGVALGALFAALVLGSVLPFEVRPPDAYTWAAMVYLVLVPGLFCFSVWYMIVEKAPVSLMVVSLAAQAPVAALLGWRVLGEPIGLNLVVGFGIILCALILGALERPVVREAAPIMPNS